MREIDAQDRGRLEHASEGARVLIDLIDPWPSARGREPRAASRRSSMGERAVPAAGARCPAGRRSLR